MRKIDKGFSLIELIVVIGIIGALVGALAVSVGSMFSQRAQQTATSAAALISKCKITSMSRAGDISLRFYKNADGNIIGDYYENGSIVQTHILGASSVVQDPPDVYISFARATGALRIFGNAPTAAPANATETIVFTSGGKGYAIDIATSTGRHAVTRR